MRTGRGCAPFDGSRGGCNSRSLDSRACPRAPTKDWRLPGCGFGRCGLFFMRRIVRRDRKCRETPVISIWYGGRGGIRTHEGPCEPWRFSRPLPSTARPPFRGPPHARSKKAFQGAWEAGPRAALSVAQFIRPASPARRRRAPPEPAGIRERQTGSSPRGR